MLVGSPREQREGELRTPCTPASVGKLVGLGLDVVVETGAGDASGFPDEEYRAAGATVGSRDDALAADIVVHVEQPDADEVAKLRAGIVHIGFLDPFNAASLVRALAEQGVTAISMQMIPRTSRAQKMDALSSQASLAGYAAVIRASELSPKIFPMMMTPAGTIAPARVFVIGAGVAGLQAIATAKRLGARVEAFDTRPVVAEEVRSLGARFVEIDVGEVGQTDQGYARELTPEQVAMQKEGMKQVVADADVVITTAQVFGRPAPRIVSRDMVEAMRPGSVVVDMAVESGGNVEGSVIGEVAVINGVRVDGRGKLPAAVARNASEMYAANVAYFIEEFWDGDSKSLNLDPDDDIVAGCVLTRDGAIVNDAVRQG